MKHYQDSNNLLSQSSKNQFMLSQSSIMRSTFNNNNEPVPQNNNIEQIFSYMKNVMSNPMLMDQMQKFLSAKQAEKNSSFILRQNQSLSVSRMEPQIHQLPQSYFIQTNKQQLQPLRINNNLNIKKDKKFQSNPNNNHFKKNSQDFSAYINNEPIEDNQMSEHNKKGNKKVISNLENIKKQNELKTEQRASNKQVKMPISFDEMPIKSNYIEQQQYSEYNSSSTMYHENEQPLKVNYDYKQKSKNTITQKTISNSNVQISQTQQRPISGTRKDFKQLLKQQFGQSPFDQRPLPTAPNNYSNAFMNDEYHQNENQYEENIQQKKPKKQFLKRGSRQYLSSAKDRKSVNKVQQNKNSQENPNNSRLIGDKTQRDKTPTKRDVSQNRILSKRNTTQNDKSVTKIKTKNNMNNSISQSYQEKKQQNNQRRNLASKNQKNQQKSTSPILPPKSSKPQINNSIKNPLSNKNESGKKKNVFDDSSSEDEQKKQQHNQIDYEEDRINNLKNKNSYKNLQQRNLSNQRNKQFDMFSRQKKQEVIEGVYLTKNQLNSILQKYMPKNQPSKQNNGEQKFNQLRKKYTDLCNIVEKQKQQHQQKMQKQQDQFENYKQQQIQKLKNQKRVMQRQMKSSMPSQSQNLQKDKQEIQNLKKQLQKQRQEHKKKQKNNKILIEKYKKENQELKFRIQRLQQEIQKQSNQSVGNNVSTSQRQSNQNSNSRSSLINNDKSKSKSTSKDVSPGKVKTSKSSKVFEQNQQEENQDKNYKKTVPLYKTAQQQKKTTSPTLNEGNKKKTLNQSNKFQDKQNSDDDNLPTFKIDNKKDDNSKFIKGQKKYQYVQANTEQISSQRQKNKYKSNPYANIMNKKSSKNVFQDESDEQINKHQQNQQNQEQNDNGFFRSAPKFKKLIDLMESNFSIKYVTQQMINNLFRYDRNDQYCKYLQRVNNPKRLIINTSKNDTDRKITNIYNDKSKEILFETGVKKQIFQDGYTIIYFKNGDIKQKLVDGTILYYFNDKKVDQITLPNGLNIYRFDNNQVQIHYDGNYIQIRHPDGTIKMLGSPIH